MVQCENEFGSSFPSVKIYRLKSTVPIMQRSKGSWLMPDLPFRCSPPMEVGCLRAGVWQVPCLRPMGRVISLILKGGEPVSWWQRTVYGCRVLSGLAVALGEPFPQVSASEIARQTEAYLQNDVSFNFYMVHGGTNFGFTSGANYDKKRDIQPDLTSYDYDALSARPVDHSKI